MKRVGSLVSLLVVLGLLAGCNAGKLWYKDGATPRDYSRDSTQCRAIAVQGSGGNMFTEIDLYNNCMYGAGWDLR